MAKDNPRVTLTPTVFNLIKAAAEERKTTPQKFIEYAVRHTIFEASNRQELGRLVALLNEHLPQLAAKIDGIGDFIADVYELDDQNSKARAAE